MGCGAAQRPGRTATAATAHAADQPAATAPGASSARLSAIAFVTPKDGYGIFTGQAGGRCHMLAGRTTDGGASFGVLVSFPRPRG